MDRHIASIAVASAAMACFAGMAWIGARRESASWLDSRPPERSEAPSTRAEEPPLWASESSSRRPLASQANVRDAAPAARSWDQFDQRDARAGAAAPPAERGCDHGSAGRVLCRSEATADPKPAAERRVSGTVVGAADGAPIAGAEIRWEPAGRFDLAIERAAARDGLAVTGQDGDFTLTIGETAAHLTVTARGWVPVRVEAPVASTRDEAAPMVIALERGLELRGRIAGPDGRPVAGAQVRGSAAGARDDPALTITTASAADGSFCLEGVVAGVVTFEIVHGAFAEHVAEHEVAGERDLGEIVLEPPIALRGRVHAARSSVPIAGSIEVRGGPRVWKVYVGNDGEFELPRLARGVYRLQYRRGRADREIEQIIELAHGPVHEITLFAAR